jgi:hypothetical protein
MRKLMVMLVAFGMFLALSATAATAQEILEVTVTASEAQTGLGDKGSTVADGTFAVSMDGNVFETGTLQSMYRGDERVQGIRTYVDDSTGNVLVTSVRALLIDVDDVNAVFTYKVIETVIASDTGATGNGTGIAIVQSLPDGSYTVESSIDFRLIL